MKPFLADLRQLTRRERGRKLAILLGFAALVCGVYLLTRPGGLPLGGPTGSAGEPEAAAGSLPAGEAPAGAKPSGAPGEIVLDDFRVIVPDTWQRKKELEDEGPGTKLFLVGPVVAGVGLVIGIDVYPLPEGTTLEDFVKQYTKSWQGRSGYDVTDATLCREAAKMVGFTESGLEKTFLLMTWRGKGFVVGMISPVGQRNRATSEFRTVLDTFQVYD